MTDPVIDFSDGPEPTPRGDTPRRRGRPRPLEIIRRDEDVLQLLVESGPLTKEQLVEMTNLPPSLTYLALWRLRSEGRVERTSSGDTRNVWRALT